MGSKPIVIFLPYMYLTVYFHHQSLLMTIKVRYEKSSSAVYLKANWMLPEKLLTL